EHREGRAHSPASEPHYRAVPALPTAAAAPPAVLRRIREAINYQRLSGIRRFNERKRGSIGGKGGNLRAQEQPVTSFFLRRSAAERPARRRREGR
ncbi:unnamed protein product, partial [Ectocarpus fasciculatus]